LERELEGEAGPGSWCELDELEMGSNVKMKDVF
jgi:hypothetical protein